jgi:tetratricopeptide (TPR) repeat protein
LPVIDLLKGYFKIQDRDDLREIREKVMGKLLTLDEALKPTLPALLALLDVPVNDAAWQALEPGQRRQLTLDAVRRLMLREAREQPVLVIFEQWIAVARTGNVVVHLPWAIAFSAWVLAQLGEASEALNRLQEGEQLLERQAARSWVVGRGWAYQSLGSTCLLLGRLDEARRQGDRAVEGGDRVSGSGRSVRPDRRDTVTAR